MTNLLDKKVAVVIGGTGGIGAATALRFAGIGARIVVCGRSVERAHDVVVRLPGDGHLATQAALDDTSSIEALASEVRSKYGRADILVNAAGFTKAISHASLDLLDDELIDSIFRINWRGQFATIRAFRRLLDESGDGLVVNVSSIAASTGSGSNVAYCAAKAGLDVMTASLGRALAPRIRILNVSPSAVDTPFVPGRGGAFNTRFAASAPLGRVGSVDDVAAAIEACATHLKFSTGSTVIVDGGRRLT